MQITNDLTYDPLEKEIDISHMKVEKAPFRFDTKEKINVWLDTLYDGCNMSIERFYDEVETALKKFCNK